MSISELDNNSASIAPSSMDFNPSFRLWPRFKKHLKDNLRQDQSLYLFIAVFLTAGYGYLGYIGQVENSHFFIYYPILFTWIVGCLFPFFAILSALAVQRRYPERQRLAYKSLISSKNLARYASGLIFLSIYILFIGMFTAIKTSLGFSFGFLHDVVQADLDKLLFMGQDAWRVLFLPIHNSWIQPIIEVNYNLLWHMHVYAVLFLVATAYPSREFRKRYLFSFMLVWVVVGNIFAGLFISAGPAFYGLVTGDEARFGQQLQMLATYKASAAVEFQRYLWDSYTTQFNGFGTGISAFPSVHVSLCVLNTFFAFEVSRRLGWISFAYMVLIMVSSVYLAWHYFIDGLAGAAIVAVIYYGTKYLQKKYQPA